MEIFLGQYKVVYVYYHLFFLFKLYPAIALHISMIDALQEFEEQSHD